MTSEPNRYFTTTDAFSLLRAAEDLQTAPTRIYSQCEEFLQATIANAFGADPPSPRAILKKSITGLTGSSQFSIIGSSVMGSQPTNSTESSGVLVKRDLKRQWDWRQGLQRHAMADDVIRLLRLGLAKELARATVEGETD
jgi:hypothetical protein